MRSNTLIKGAGFCGVLVLLLSCGPKKRIVPSGGSEVRMSGVNKAVVLGQMAQQQLHYTTFSGRAKSNLTINGKARYDVTANVRIVRDEAIWISVTALMGIEAARVFITPDSVKIVNRLQAEYVRKPFAYLGNFTGSELDFSSLQQLLVGDVIGPITESDVEVWQGANGYLVQKQTDDLQYMVRLDADYQNSYTSINEPARSQKLEAFYSDYQTATGNTFPYQLELSVAIPGLALHAEMKYNRVVYDENVELPFSVPSRYSEIQ